MAFLLIWIVLFGIKLPHHTFVIPHRYSMSWFGPGILTYSGLELIRPGSPSVGGSGNESIGLEFVHFRVVILMQIVLRFSKEGFVSFILSSGLSRNLQEFLTDYIECSFIKIKCPFRSKPIKADWKSPYHSHQNLIQTNCHFSTLIL